MPEQLFIVGTEPPPDQSRVPEIDDAIADWLEAKAKQKLAAEVSTVRHESMVQRMLEAGVEKYPHVDGDGKRRVLVVPQGPRRAKLMRAEPSKRERQDAEFERERAAAESKPDDTDPFASTREQLGKSAPTSPTPAHVRRAGKRKVQP